MTWQTEFNKELQRELANAQPLIYQAKKEAKRVYLITSRFHATKNEKNFSCSEEVPYVGNEGLRFTLTREQEALLRGIANYESSEDMNKQDLTAIVTIMQGSLMQYPFVKGIGYQGTYILLDGKRKNNYLDEQEVCAELKRREIVRRAKKGNKVAAEQKTRS